MISATEVEMTAALETQTRAALHRRVPELLEKAGQPRLSLEYTVSLMHLTIVKPSHWQTLGPLVWARLYSHLPLRPMLVSPLRVTGLEREKARKFSGLFHFHAVWRISCRVAESKSAVAEFDSVSRRERNRQTKSPGFLPGFLFSAA